MIHIAPLRSAGLRLLCGRYYWKNLMKTIIISDIFGRTAPLERLVEKISEDALILFYTIQSLLGLKMKRLLMFIFLRMSVLVPTLIN